MTAWRWDPDLQERVLADMAAYMRGGPHDLLLGQVDAWAETFRRRALEHGPLVVVAPRTPLGDALAQRAAEAGHTVQRPTERGYLLRIVPSPSAPTVQGPALCPRCVYPS